MVLAPTCHAPTMFRLCDMYIYSNFARASCGKYTIGTCSLPPCSSSPLVLICLRLFLSMLHSVPRTTLGPSESCRASSQLYSDVATQTSGERIHLALFPMTGLIYVGSFDLDGSFSSFWQ